MNELEKLQIKLKELEHSPTIHNMKERLEIKRKIMEIKRRLFSIKD